MLRIGLSFTVLCWAVSCSGQDRSFEADVAPLLEASCLECHGAGTTSGPDLTALGNNLSDPHIFRSWESLYDRVAKGEMPPPEAERPDQEKVATALAALQRSLTAANRAQQEEQGRVPARRLTKLELEYTLHDLLSIDGEVTASVPAETDSGNFDTVGSAQRISELHLQGYLEAADKALHLAIQLGVNPTPQQTLDFAESALLNHFHEKDFSLGGNISRRTDDSVVLFRDADYLLTSAAGGFQLSAPGIYRITTQAAAFQAEDPVELRLVQSHPDGSTRLLISHKLVPGREETIVVSTLMQPGDSFHTTIQTKTDPAAAILAAGGAKHYSGPGIALNAQQVEGPLVDPWPPASTRQLLTGLHLVAPADAPAGPYRIEPEKEMRDHVHDVVAQLAPRAFRRPVAAEEIESFVALAERPIAAGRDPLDVLRIPLQALLCAPAFLCHEGPPGMLDDHAVASRLSYFLWKSLPDEQLTALAADHRLSSPEVLAAQVDRMLADPKAQRFIRDFVGQWLRLSRIDATTPDEKLYPEYDPLLSDAAVQESECFFRDLLERNLEIGHLVAADFTFLNERLARHYSIPGVQGPQMRRVSLPQGSPRGGLLTQASILKTTANGTVTSPVARGNFVLTNILGLPPRPPPPGISSIEPDTRGKTTIREILAAHRTLAECNSCHRQIDPPGFALECFDPIGGFRTRYRADATPSSLPWARFFASEKTYREGPPVDASGVTADGRAFSGIVEFKRLLLDQQEQIARHFLSRLIVYSTGGEIEFADREEIEAILARTRDRGFPLRDLLQACVQSRLFRER